MDGAMTNPDGQGQQQGDPAIIASGGVPPEAESRSDNGGLAAAAAASRSADPLGGAGRVDRVIEAVEPPPTIPAELTGDLLDRLPVAAVEVVDGTVDPCAVACAAMPARVAGDLTAADLDWLADHTAGCRYCARELGRYERVGAVLDRAAALAEAEVVVRGGPPPVPLPRSRPARYARVASPLGPLFVAVSEQGLCEIDFADHVDETGFVRRLTARGFAPRAVDAPLDAHDRCDREIIAQVARQLGEYFQGQRDRFDLPIDLSGVSPFTRRVLSATAEVPFGRLETYRGIAQRVGKPGATRAVGNALGRNPIPVVVPCHRIVRSDGSLGGYTGGPHIKPHLLALEGVAIA